MGAMGDKNAVKPYIRLGVCSHINRSRHQIGFRISVLRLRGRSPQNKQKGKKMNVVYFQTHLKMTI
jgi:hypothetical protein